MKKLLITLILLAYSVFISAQEHPLQVEMHTSAGLIVLELDAQAAPVTVENFLRYVDEGFYEGLMFHRVIPGFMIQGGGFTHRMEQKSSSYPAIRNESGNGLSNLRGTIAMARTQNPDSATSQFFINVADNLSLDARTGRPGYAVFGRVIEGMDVVDQIVAAPTTRVLRHENVPVSPVLIEKTSRRSLEHDAPDTEADAEE